jgi:molecular chaperone HscA
VLRLINEPTAAALAYGLENQSEGVYAIYDLGGGTFDVSLLNLEQGVFQVLATAGDTALGGDDVDRLIAQAAGLSLTDEHLMQARRAKEAMAEQDSVMIGSLMLTHQKLAALVAPLLERTLKICDQVFEDAGVHRATINGVVLVGGSTRLKALQQIVARYFGQQPLKNVDPDRVVAYGAARQAVQLTEGGNNLLLDVTPLSLGLETMGGIVEKIIWRNTPTPTSVSQEFTTNQDGHTAMDIHVLQGEREMVTDCRSLGRFTLRGIPAMTAGAARIKITFTIDADGVLRVLAEEMTTNTTQQIEVKPSYGLPLEEMEQMLRESMVHAEEDIMERLLREARVEAERTLFEIRSALKADGSLLTEAECGKITSEMQALEAAIYGDDRDMIDIRHQQLQHVVGAFAQKRMDKAIATALKGTNINAIAKDTTHA